MKNRSANVVWVTGSAGFIGRHMCEVLRREGKKTVEFVRPKSVTKHSKNVYELSPECIQTALEEWGAPTEVYHLAGGSTVGRSIVDPLSDYAATCHSLFLVLDAIKASQSRMVLASSAAVYGNQGSQHGLTPKMPAQPLSPYGHHKMFAEQLAKTVSERHGLPLVICRLFSVYGSGLTKQLPFELCKRISAAGKGEQIILGGTGLERRDWVSVSDVVSALRTSTGSACSEAPIFNVGSTTGSTISEMASLLLRFFERDDLTIKFSGEIRAGDPIDLFPSADTLPPKYTPKISLQAGLKEYVTWFKDVNNELQ